MNGDWSDNEDKNECYFLLLKKDIDQAMKIHVLTKN